MPEVEMDLLEPRGNMFSMWALRRALHIGYHQMRTLIEREGYTVYCVKFPSGRVFRYVSIDDAIKLELGHAGQGPRAERLDRCPGTRRRPRLRLRCPQCFDAGRQWRNGIGANGNQKVQCGNCGRYWVNCRRPPLMATCPYCGASDRQRRQGKSEMGNQKASCGRCKRGYTIDGDPDEEERLWLQRRLRIPVPKDYWKAEWQSIPAGEWPERMRQLGLKVSGRGSRSRGGVTG